MVSNCNSHSQRENYVAKLMEFIQIDVYGKCGQIKCSREMNQDCLKQMDSKYKFYLRSVDVLISFFV